MKMISISDFKEVALKIFKPEATDSLPTNPIMFLYSLNWEVPSGDPFLEEEIAKMNLRFDLRSCFGRSVKAAVIAQTYFPYMTFYAGEVCNDLLRTMLIDRATSSDWADKTYLNEILQYEKPHSVLVCDNGQQFDPIFKYLSFKPENLGHPSVVKYDLWSGLHAAYLVSEALLIKNSRESLDFLLQVQSMYPENMLVRENIAGKYGALGNLGKTVEMVKEAVEVRKDAKMLWLLWNLTIKETYRKRIISEYSEQMFNHLNHLYL